MEVTTGVSEINMSIENMTTVSYLMFAISGVCAVTAVVLFFALDIAKCWRMAGGRHLVSRKKHQKAEHITAASKAVTEKIRQSEETFLLSDKSAAEFAADQETVLLGYGDRTEVLGTVSLEMIQDIVYMQDTTEMGQALPDFYSSD